MFALREPRMSRKANALVRIFREMDMLFSEAGLERQLEGDSACRQPVQFWIVGGCEDEKHRI